MISTNPPFKSLNESNRFSSRLALQFFSLFVLLGTAIPSHAGPSQCTISGVGYPSGSVNPANACQVCNPTQSTTSWSTKTNGTVCDDGNPATINDSCQNGTCIGTSPVCTPLDQCHVAGTYNPSTGTCSNPNAQNGTVCDDGNPATLNDSCQNGTCIGTSPVCTPLDQCHVAGTYNPSTGTCSNPNAPNGTICDDGNPTTVDDTCQNGTCVGIGPNTCTPLDQCHVAGTYNPSTGTCSNPVAPDGTVCNDGNQCTLTDVCQSGVCTGLNMVTCTPLDECHTAGTCNPSTGTCSNPTLNDPQCISLFANGGFETGTAGSAPPSWTLNTDLNSGGGFTLQTPQTFSGLNLAAGGIPLTVIEQSAGGPLTQTDADLGSAASLRWPRYGNQMASVNEQSAATVQAQNANSLSQAVTVASGDIDSSDNKLHLRFAFAPILQNAGLPQAQQPYYFIQVTNTSQGNSILYTDFVYAGQSGIPWQSVNTGSSNEIDYTDWQLVDVAAGSPAVNVGDSLQLQVIASGSVPGSQYGKVWLDGAGNVIFGISVEGSAPATVVASANLTYTLAYQNGASTAEDNVVVNFVTPANSTYQGVTAPVTCTAPAVGSTGTVSCNLGTLAAGATGSLTITLKVSTGTPNGTFTARNYGISSTQETTLLGPPIVTTVGGCTAVLQCGTGDWCQESTGVCRSTLPNGTPIPTDPAHFNPTLNGMCTTAAATLVCTSGVCDTSTNNCGYNTGDGPCNAGNAAVVCDSGFCSTSGNCEPAGGCLADADCVGGSWCNESIDTCFPKLANGTPLPIDPRHSPVLNGTCTAAAAALVCASGVCDTSDNECGYRADDGPCTSGDAATVCRSGVCSTNGLCEPVGGCFNNADCASGQFCSVADQCLATLSITQWPTASAITLGQALSASTLSGGQATVAGTFTWTNPATIPALGSAYQSVTFTPNDLVNYTAQTSTSSVQLTVNPPPISYLVVTTAQDDDGSAAASNCTEQTTPGTGTDLSCSLRDALIQAATLTPSNISFNTTQFSSLQTIVLANGVLNIPSSTTINAPTTGSGATLANLVTVSGNHASPVFNINSGVTAAAISGLNILNGTNTGNLDDRGGGIINAGALTVTGSTIAGNTASGTATAFGGGVYNTGMLSLVSSTVSGNSAAGPANGFGSAFGGGIANQGTLTLTNTTISGNSATAGGKGYGGGLYSVYSANTVTVSSATISTNAADFNGGGLYTSSSTVSLVNTVLAGNSAPNNPEYKNNGGRVDDNGGNLIGDVTLAPLANYGGPTQTQLPLPGSEAICGGTVANDSALTTDQRGFARTTTYGSACADAGAVQTNYTSVQFDHAGYSANLNEAINPGPVVSVTENGQNIAAVPLTLTFAGTGTAAGLGPVTTVEGAGAAFPALSVNTVGSGDSLSISLLLIADDNPVTAPPLTASATLQINPLLTPSVVLTLTGNPATGGSTITLTATVSGAGVKPSGSVRFFADYQPLGLVALNGSGVATFLTNSLPIGVHSIAASYTGDLNYIPRNAVPVTATVTKDPSSVTVGSSAPSAGIGSPVTLTATVSGSNGAPIGTVSFYFGSSLIGQGTLAGGVATLQLSTLPSGFDTITARYPGSATYLPSVSANLTQRITTQATTVALAPTPNPVSFGSQLTITATVATTLTGVAPTGSVRFFDGYTLLGTGTVSAGVATYQTSALSVGKHSFTANYTGDADYSAASGTASATVSKAATTVAVTTPNNTSTLGQPVTFTATVSTGTATANPTGTINFYSGNTSIGTGVLSGNTATLTTTTLPHGVLTITAQFWGDTNYLPAKSPNLTEIVH